MPSFSQVVIIDELSINNDDKEKIKSGKTSKLEETLAWLADNTAMTLAALSSTFLLDKGTFGTTVSHTALDEMIARTGFIGSIQLKFIMRSSQNIAAGTSTASVNQTYTRSYKIPGTISPGSSSTVPGTRPRAWVYKHTRDTDYTKLAGFVTQHLRTVDTERLKCVVLTDDNISPRLLCSEMRRMLNNTPVRCFDAGVEMFNGNGTPIYQEGAGDGGEVELTAWLSAEGGVLVTSEWQYRGAECDSVIFITEEWTNYASRSVRSPVTRAVAGLLMITGDGHLSVKGLRRDWEVTILEKGSGSDSETEDSND